MVSCLGRLSQRLGGRICRAKRHSPVSLLDSALHVLYSQPLLADWQEELQQACGFSDSFSLPRGGSQSEGPQLTLPQMHQRPQTRYCRRHSKVTSHFQFTATGSSCETLEYPCMRLMRRGFHYHPPPTPLYIRSPFITLLSRQEPNLSSCHDQSRTFLLLPAFPTTHRRTECDSSAISTILKSTVFNYSDRQD